MDIVHYMAVMNRFRNALSNPAWICFLWAGMNMGIAVIETPARFAAATITRPIALDVGRGVFAALNKAELIALVIMLIVVRASGHAVRLWSYCGVLALIVVAQSVWLTPELAERAQMIINGVEPPKSYAHAIYSSLELLKFGLLLFLGFTSLGSNRSGGRTGAA